jgi:hypothetical protein
MAIGEMNAKTSEIEQDIQIQNQRQDDQTIISKLDQILSKLPDASKSPTPSNADYSPSQLDGIIKQLSDLQRSIDINTAYDPAAFGEIRKELDDISKLIAEKMADQKQNLTINVPVVTSTSTAQGKPGNAIGLFNVNAERH